MHALEKILAKNSGRKVVKTGEIVTCKIDFAEVNDLYLQVIESFEEMGGKKVWDPSKVAFVMDHYAPAPTIKSAANQKAMREFVWDQGIKYLFDINAGVCHQVMPEAGIVYPGMILIATDSHTTTHGAFGAFGTGVGATDLACILMTGELWLRVPEIINIEIKGKLKDGVLPKDIILKILGELKTDAAVYKGIEFTGETIKDLDMAGRIVLCNMAVELGAKVTYIQPDEKTFEYLKKYGVDVDSIDIPFNDPSFEYDGVYKFDVSDLVPQVAIPHSPDNVVPVDAVAGIKVDQVFIGACTGGRVEDLEAVYRAVKGKKINAKTRLVIIPASKDVYLEALRRGYIEAFIEAGATVTAPGCGPCLGAHQGVIAPGEVCVTASNRNFPGRMGSTGAKIYLASPLTAALCAVEGKIVNPMDYLKEE